MAGQPEKPAIQPLNTRVNLDEVFGYVYQNVISDVVTPYRLVVNELIQLIQEIDPEDSVLFREESLEIYAMILGMINREDMPYKDVVRCVRYLDKSIRPEIRLYDQFRIKMDSKLKGESKRVVYPASRRRNEDEESRFLYKSPVHLFSQKLYVAGNNITQQQTFEMHQKLKDYINGVWPIKLSGVPLPFEINTSIKARQWIRKQMHLLQVCPTEAASEKVMLEYCEKIEKYHPDIPDVFLLRTIYYIIKKNFQKAHDCLRTFTDLSVMKPYTGLTPEERQRLLNPANLLQTGTDSEGPARMGLPDQRPFRYGPMLSARLYRMVGENKMALALLQEAIKEAQAASDSICAKYINLEMQLLQATKPVESTDPEEVEIPAGDRESTHFICDPKNTDQGKLLCLREDRDAEEHYMSINTMISSQIQLCDLLNTFRQGKWDNDELGPKNTDISALDDLNARAREIRDAGVAAMQTYRYFNCYQAQARSLAISYLATNGTDGTATHHETEPYAIMEINLAYQNADEGHWMDALASVEKMEKKYPISINPKCGKHVQIAKYCLYFNSSFNRGKFDECEEHLLSLEGFSYEEWFLRSTLMLAIRGNLNEAVELLENEYLRLKRREIEDIYIIRIACQYAITDMLLSCAEPRTQMLRDLRERQKLKKFRLYTLMSRKLAVLLLMAGDFQGAYNEVATFYPTTLIDDAMIYLIRGNAHQGLNDIPAALESYKEAEKLLLKAECPILAKEAMKRILLLETDKEVKEMKLLQFNAMDDQFPGYVNWVLI